LFISDSYYRASPVRHVSRRLASTRQIFQTWRKEKRKGR
jgi:hypothetical protein